MSLGLQERCWDLEKRRDFSNYRTSTHYEPSKYHLEIYKKSNIDTFRYEKDGTARTVMPYLSKTYEDVDMHCLKHTEYIMNSKLHVNREKITLSIAKLKPNETKLVVIVNGKNYLVDILQIYREFHIRW